MDSSSTNSTWRMREGEGSWGLSADNYVDMFGAMLPGNTHPLNETPGLKWFFVVALICQSTFGTVGNLLVGNED
ncbi:hypothetical protein BV898_14533 [Hypsibius exemplaris]|uniref:Uncharacterized protein n=1 Tax=Hypsibius exemplaris TaxID=2072580 RepID=A0A9X6RJL4_HYPEX|nr:hypothetical protein BV898_14533 [Hypsibius exemplaris]